MNRKSGLFGPTMLLTGHEGEAEGIWSAFSHEESLAS